MLYTWKANYRKATEFRLLYHFLSHGMGNHKRDLLYLLQNCKMCTGLYQCIKQPILKDILDTLKSTIYNLSMVNFLGLA